MTAGDLTADFHDLPLNTYSKILANARLLNINPRLQKKLKYTIGAELANIHLLYPYEVLLALKYGVYESLYNSTVLFFSYLHHNLPQLELRYLMMMSPQPSMIYDEVLRITKNELDATVSTGDYAS